MRRYLLIPVLFLLCLPLFAADKPGQAAVATAHPLATQAAIEILKQGGNAFDAAVAVSAVLAVVEPYSSGIGGGGFWLLHRAEDGQQIMIDGREVAPGFAYKTMYLDSSSNVIPGLSLNGPKAAGIPGMVAGIAYINDYYGRLKLDQNLAAAIRYAEQGFPVTDLYRKMVEFRLEPLRASADAARIFLHENNTPPVGYILKQPELAETLKKIAKDGSTGFYNGPLAEKMAQGVALHGGLWTLNDLQNYRIQTRKPIVTQYHDLKIISAPPPSSGGIVLAQALNILKHFELQSMDNITRKHVIIEALRRAYRDRATFLGDPDFTTIPLQQMMNEDYLEGLALSIDLEHATPNDEIGEMDISEQTGTDTTHFSILDAEGNRVAATLSINLPFGSGFVVPGTGVLLNNEMDDFAIKPLVPNAYGLVGNAANSIAPGKRPLSSMTPTFIEADDRVGILGTPGGSRIISMVLLGVLNAAEKQLPKSWVSVPRFHHQYLPDEVQFEQGGLTAQEQAGLTARGHKLREQGRRYGNMQAVLWYKPNNLVFAASDPRGEGEATTLIPAAK